MLTVLVGLALTGCPTMTPVAPPTDNPPVVTPPEEVEMAKVKLTFGELEKAQELMAEKAMTNDQLYELIMNMESSVSRIQIRFIEPEDWDRFGMNASWAYNDTVDLINGQARETIAVPVGRYHLVVMAYDDVWQAQFVADLEVCLVPGLNHVGPILLHQLPMYHYQIFVEIPQGNFSTEGWALSENIRIFDADGNPYFGGKWWWNGSLVVCEFDLPLFAGPVAISPADLDGNVFSFDAYVSPLRQSFWVEYAESEIAAELDIDLGFVKWVIANGQLYDSLQAAIDVCESPVDIRLFAGIYQGPVNTYNKTVIAEGAGADKTFVYAPGTVFFSSSFATKGGGVPLVRLSNLQVIGNEASPPSNGYQNGVIFAEGITLDLQNVVVKNNATYYNGIVTNYCSSVRVNHCVIDGTGFGDGLVLYNEQDVVISNSIILDASIGIYADNGDVTTEYCVMWNVGQWSYVSRRGSWNDIRQVGCWPLNQINPNLGSDYRLPLDSKLRGVISYGGDVGVQFPN